MVACTKAVSGEIVSSAPFGVNLYSILFFTEV